MRRIACLLVVLVVGLLGLPTAAWWLDGSLSEDWLLPVAFGVPALVGTVLWVGVPGLTTGPAHRRAAVGAAYGAGAALVGVVVLFVMVNGSWGA